MKAVILAGGEGSRLRPLTFSRPKAMIPVANTPIIEYDINALVANGIRDITVVVGYRKEQVIRHLNKLDIPINVVVQEKQLGPAHALRCAESEIDDDFILLPGDNYVDAASIATIIKVKNALLVKEHPYPSNFGVVSLRDGYVEGIIEKPEYSPRFTVSTGIYALNTDIFNYLDGVEIPDALGEMIAAGTRIQALPAKEWYDAVYPWDLLRINAHILKNITSLKSGNLSGSMTIRGPVHIGEGTTIGSNTSITGPVIIGEDCEIGPNASILPNTSIGSRVKIEPFTYIEHSIVMDDARIGSHSRFCDSVIGEGSSLADHTTTCTGRYLFEEDEKLQGAKFGAIVGDRVLSSPFTVLKHCVVGNHVKIEEGRVLTDKIPDHAVVK